MRDGRLRQLTHDHSLVQELLDSGAISLAEAEHHPRRNIITRAMGGADEAAELEKVSDRLSAGDRFLLCSDGLFKTLPEGDLVGLMVAGAEPLAEHLVAAALDRRADDNVTAVTVEMLCAAATAPSGSVGV